MPRSASYTLRWSAEHEHYELQSQENVANRPWHEDWWFAWLAEHASFSFHGKHGHLSLLKEARARGGDYWYAYRSLNRRTVKRYAGRTVDLTAAHLEELARMLASEAPVVADDTEHQETASSAKEATEGQTHTRPVPTPAAAPLPYQFPLLSYKLQPPRLPSSLIPRERLLAQLDAALGQPVTLLSAPAGFGKTTLVSQWLSARGTTTSSLTWLTLDEGDNHLLRFWRYLLAACQGVQAHLGSTALAHLSAALQPPFNPPHMETVLTLLLNDLAHLPATCLLVLDNYHVISEPGIHETMAFWLEHLPASLHVLLLSRNTPTLPLARLRARGELCEIQAADLRFTVAETGDFLQYTLALSPDRETLAQLDSHLEGWAAGLRLLALALRGHTSQQDVAHHLASFAGSHRLILDYFVSEVLSSQSKPRQDFLLRTSVLNQFSGALCDCVTGRQDSAQQLAEIEQAGLFLEVLDGAGEWFRYHALFAEAMRTEAQRRLGVDTLRTLSTQASIWFEAQGRFTEAIEAALQAQNMQRAIVLIGQLIGARPLHELQDVHTLLLWLQQIPEAPLKYYPLLCQHYAAALLFSGKVIPAQFAQLEKLLQMAEDGWRTMGNTAKLGETQTFRAMIASRQGARQRALALAREALTRLPAEEKAWRYIGSGIVGIGALQEGQINEAHEVLQALRAYWEAVGNVGAMRGITLLLGNIAYEQAALHKAEDSYRQVLALAREAQDRNDIAHALRSLAVIAYERNELVTAEQQAREALSIGKQIADTELQVQVTLFLAHVEHARGQGETALQRCASLYNELPTVSPIYTPLYAQLNSRIQAEQARFHLAIGNHTAVQRWANSRQQHNEQISRSQREHEELIIVRLLIVQGKREEAQDMLTRLLTEACEAGRIRSTLEIQLLQATAYAASKQLQEARRHLLRVLTQAHTEGFLRLFLDEGETMATLLHTLIPHIYEQTLRIYARGILHAFVQERGETEASADHFPRQLIEPLSSQEIRVLRLLVAGRSNRDIAAEQIVSINTIRTQVQSIYRKLGVNNRVAASEIARQFHLL
ncbi:MAG: LuxR C-terminal-related transcriptional regulator [Ktedonobacteraceae bacterium]